MLDSTWLQQLLAVEFPGVVLRWKDAAAFDEDDPIFDAFFVPNERVSEFVTYCMTKLAEAVERLDRPQPIIVPHSESATREYYPQVLPVEQRELHRRGSLHAYWAIVTDAVLEATAVDVHWKSVSWRMLAPRTTAKDLRDLRSTLQTTTRPRWDTVSDHPPRREWKVADSEGDLVLDIEESVCQIVR